MENEKLQAMLDTFINPGLRHVILSSPRRREELQKVKIRPVLLKGGVVYQAEEFSGSQVFHKNMDGRQATEYIKERLREDFGQCEVLSEQGAGQALVSRRGIVSVKIKKSPQPILPGEDVPMEHNRKKRYLLEEGKPVPFLEDLGVMTAEGKVVRAKYDKYRQINRFLEFIEDVLPSLDRERENVIIDFGCGKSYLTFAMYYYLHVLKGYPVRILGLDLKKDVIVRCSRLAGKFGFENLQFLHGDIGSFEGISHVDMVVTLHACDTATDHALAKAVAWGAKVILSVPCCQHELNRQIRCQSLAPVLGYGLIRERTAALYTDAIRAQVLEYYGYRTQILEFIDMEHTPKNILIRAVRQGKKKQNGSQILELTEFLHVEPCILKLLPVTQ